MKVRLTQHGIPYGKVANLVVQPRVVQRVVMPAIQPMACLGPRGLQVLRVRRARRGCRERPGPLALPDLQGPRGIRARRANKARRANPGPQVRRERPAPRELLAQLAIRAPRANQGQRDLPVRRASPDLLEPPVPPGRRAPMVPMRR